MHRLHPTGVWHTISRRIVGSSLIAMLSTTPSCVAPALAMQQAMNRVVVIIDASGSYRSRVNDAMESTLKLLEGMAQIKLHRWEGGNDRISVVSLDAMPEVIWEGTLKDLKTAGPEAWRARFQARTDYAQCTDVGAAFRLALQQLEGDSRLVRKYLFVYSDLIDEPPTNSLHTCARPRPIPEDLSWERLSEISVSVFWMPPNQKLLWQRAAIEHGLGAQLRLHTVSESSEAPPVPPGPAMMNLTETERDANRQAMTETLWSFGKGLGMVGAAIFGLIFLAAGFASTLGRIRQRRLRRLPMPQANRRQFAQSANTQHRQNGRRNG